MIDTAYNLPHLNDLLKATDDQAFLVIPALAVSISQNTSDVGDIPQQGVLLEVSETDDQAVVSTFHVSTNRKAHHRNIPR